LFEISVHGVFGFFYNSIENRSVVGFVIENEHVKRALAGIDAREHRLPKNLAQRTQVIRVLHRDHNDWSPKTNSAPHSRRLNVVESRQRHSALWPRDFAGLGNQQAALLARRSRSSAFELGLETAECLTPKGETRSCQYHYQVKLSIQRPGGHSEH